MIATTYIKNSGMYLLDEFLAISMDLGYRQKLSEAVRKARGERSLRQFAKDLGVSFNAVRGWEEGESLPVVENLELIAAALGYSLEEFLEHLRGDDVEAKRPRIAEEVLLMAEGLSREELVRLAQMIVGKLGKSSTDSPE